MSSEPPRRAIHLLANHPLRLDRARGVGIVCRSGNIWVTVAGQADDIFLGAGQHYSLNSNRLALVEAIDGGIIELLPPEYRLSRLVDWLSATCPAFPHW